MMGAGIRAILRRMIFLGAACLAAAAALAGCQDKSAPAPGWTQRFNAVDEAEGAALKALTSGQMEKVIVHSAPRPFHGEAFSTESGQSLTLADFAGKVTLVNFWATWCPPCRKEMPALDALQKDMGGNEFTVVAISLDKGGAAKARGFFNQTGIGALTLYTDSASNLAKAMDVLNLPITVALDRDGREVARMMGDADWNAPESRAFLRRLMDATQGKAE